MTPGNVHDSQECANLLLGDETALYADAAYSSKQTRETLAKLGIEDQVQRKGYRGKPLSKGERTRNKEIAITRAGGERPFATYKRHYGLARTRFMGLAKNATIFGLAAMAANIRKGAQFLRERRTRPLPPLIITGPILPLELQRLTLLFDQKIRHFQHLFCTAGIIGRNTVFPINHQRGYALQLRTTS